MIQREFEIRNENGLHTRPGNAFVQTAKGFACEIRAIKAGTAVDAKSLLKLMRINVVQGDRLCIQCEGPDEAAAMEALAACLATLGE